MGRYLFSTIKLWQQDLDVKNIKALQTNHMADILGNPPLITETLNFCF